MSTFRKPIIAALSVLLAGVGATAALPMTSQAAVPDCAAFTSPVYYRTNPQTRSAFLTSSQSESTKSVTHGFTTDHKTLFEAAAAPGTVLKSVHRMRRTTTGDYLFTANSGEISSASKQGYVDEGSSFYASPSSAACLVPVYRYLLKSRHQYAVSSADRNALVGAGWKIEGVAFYVGAKAGAPPTSPPPSSPPPPGETSFTFAMMPDTQQEVLRSSDSRFINRTKWLVKEKSSLNLKFVGHTGDVVNWDTPDHSQTKVASAAMKPLEAAGIPYTLSIGNHDSQATMSPGGARDPKHTRTLARNTSVFNSYFNAGRYTSVAGAYESGKVDNIYATYSAGGVKWMVLVLEIWPRKAVVEWARNVVASHPNYNVIITTHSYLNGGSSIYQKSDYGDTSPQYLYDNLVKQYANIKFVFSGHAGIAANRVDTGVHNNKIFTFEQTFHSNTTNPVRLITVNTKAGTVKSWIYGPINNTTFPQFTTNQTGLAVVR